VAELTQEVLKRYSRQFLAELTQQDEQGAQDVQMSVLQAAAEDAESQFLTEGGVVYDGSKKQHVQVCCLGVVYFLHLFTGRYTDALAAAREDWVASLRRFSRGAGDRARLLPVSSSPLVPSTQPQGTRPDMDRDRWDSVVPDMPGGGRNDAS